MVSRKQFTLYMTVQMYLRFILLLSNILTKWSVIKWSILIGSTATHE